MRCVQYLKERKMSKHIKMKLNRQQNNEREYNTLKDSVFKKVKARYDWAMSMTQVHIAHTPYFQQYFFANMEKPNFESQKIKDKLYIEALRHYGILPNEGETPRQYMYNAYETKFGTTI